MRGGLIRSVTDTVQMIRLTIYRGAQCGAGVVATATAVGAIPSHIHPDFRVVAKPTINVSNRPSANPIVLDQCRHSTNKPITARWVPSVPIRRRKRRRRSCVAPNLEYGAVSTYVPRKLPRGTAPWISNLFCSREDCQKGCLV